MSNPHHPSNPSDDEHLHKARHLLRTNEKFRAAMRKDPDSALREHEIHLSEPVRKRVKDLDWNVDDTEMIQRSNNPPPS